MLNDVAPCAFCECAPLVANSTLVVSATFPICGCGGGEAVTCNYMCVCVVLFYLTVMSDFDVVLCLLWRLYRRTVDGVGSLPVFPVWSECVCVDKVVLVLRVSGGTCPIGTMCCGCVLGVLLCECFCLCAGFVCVCCQCMCGAGYDFYFR